MQRSHAGQRALSLMLTFPGLMICCCFSTPAQAKVRIYGGPVPSAGSGVYYPPGDQVYGSQSERHETRKFPTSRSPNDLPRIDLNPRFVPGTDFLPPGYVPYFYPRQLYFPDYSAGEFSQPVPSDAN